ncbi:MULTISPECIES: adhesion domain-containing protein [Citrobacter]|nr:MULTISPECIES: DUF823 domain-containing adhesin [Citrobacter]
MKKILSILLLLAMSFGIPPFSAQAAFKGGTWQTTPTSTGEIKGTSPQADSAAIAVYQGSIQLDPTKTYAVPFSATPGDFSADTAASHLILTNPHDTEGDLFAAPPALQWENQQPPGADLVWADAATPETLLDPQPVDDKSFCAQNLAGRHLVTWPQVNSTTPLPLLYLSTLTGSPATGTVALQDKRVAIDIAPSPNAPLTVSASHYDDTLKAAKVKAGESITLTITTHDCTGNVLNNVPFVITRSDARGRQGDVNNSLPVHIGNTELISSGTEYQGVTDANGTATVTVTQDGGPGVKTTLKVKPSKSSVLETDVDVIFTTLTSPNSDKAAMWGHMVESTTVGDFTFSRPKLSGETSGANGSATDHNEVWALFDWNNANSHCNSLLPDLRRLVALDVAQGTQTIQETLGWPIQGNNYWSASPGDSGRHFAVDMNGQESESRNDSEHYLVSCVDHAMPVVIPKITLTPDHYDTTLTAAKAMTGESITMTVTITDSVTGEPLPHTYYSLALDPAHNRANETSSEWETSPVVIAGEQIQASDPHLYEGVTDASGAATVVLTQPHGAGVRTTITAEMREGYTATDSKDVIFTVITSPDSDKARMWGHMKDAATADGSLFVRPLLAAESSYEAGNNRENNEDWATFTQLSKAESQCGDGQVPSANSLEKLYAGHSANQIVTDLGWPTEGYSYLSADTDGTTYHNVSLKNGDQGSFTGSTSNYLSCAATGLVSQLQVITNGDASQRQAKAKAGEPITLTVQTTNAVNDLPAPNVAFTVTSGESTNRQGSATGFTSGGPLMVNGQSFGTNSGMTGTYQGITDAQGQAQLVIEQPKGPGVKTPLTIKLDDSRVADAINYEVIFTAVTSPDTDKAQMWGHMDDSVTVGDDTFYRPKLTSEFTTTPSGSTRALDNEVWGILTSASAQSSAAGGCETSHLPSTNQMKALYNANKDNKLNTEHGWQTVYSYWTSTLSSGGPTVGWDVISMTSGATGSSGAGMFVVSCLKDANPVATQITLETTDKTQWSETLNAARVKKGDTLRLKLMTKDSAGNPVPDTSVVISRGDDYSRQDVKESSPASMVINGLSLANQSSLLYASTGADGSLILEITRANTKGTKAVITAKLFDNDSVTADMGSIFTVATSPDSAKATYWGHMPETLTATDGTVFKRPILFNELAQTSGYKSSSENYETWAVLTYPQAQDNASSGCDEAHIPTRDSLDSLYNAYPGGKIESEQGWPTYTYYWSNTADSSVTASRNYYTVSLYSDSSSGMAQSQTKYLTCLDKAKAKGNVAQIELTSAQYVPELKAAKVKKGEIITWQIEFKDAQGNILPNVAFSILGAQSTKRNGEPYSAYLYAGYPGGSATYLSGSTRFYGVTDSNGQALVEVSGGAGFEGLLSVSPDENSALVENMASIFTIVTSPDSDKAAMWGHMPDTITVDDIVFERPKLAAEAPSASGHTTISNESWATVRDHNVAFNNPEAGGCAANHLPQIAQMSALYAAHSGNKISTEFGWPVTSGYNYWTSTYYYPDRVSAWYSIELKSGYTYSASGSSWMMITCLKDANPVPSKIVIKPADSTQWDASLNVAKAKSGDTLHLNVTVEDASGKPIPATMLTISRGNDYNRQAVQESAQAMTVNGSTLTSPGSTSNLSTDDAGNLLLDVTRPSTVKGTKAPITLSITDIPGVTSSLDTVFTVLTSPDSSKAQYWGHMPETVTSSAGVVFRRPMLQAEIGVGSYSSTNNEKWSAITYPQASSLNIEGCSIDKIPLLKEWQTLYGDHPGGAVATLYGWPTNYVYWGADLTADNKAQSINLASGSTQATASTSTVDYAMLVCLAQTHNTSKSTGFMLNSGSQIQSFVAEKKSDSTGGIHN